MTRIVIGALLVCALGVSTLAQETARRPPASTAQAAVVNINTATTAQLESLPGIGKATADRIIEYRQKSGGFKKIEELMNVRGIGEKSFLKLKPLVTVTSPKSEAPAP